MNWWLYAGNMQVKHHVTLNQKQEHDGGGPDVTAGVSEAPYLGAEFVVLRAVQKYTTRDTSESGGGEAEQLRGAGFNSPM